MSREENRGAPSLSNAAWARFATDHWGATPTVLRAPFGAAAPRSEDLFPAVVAACDAGSRGSASARLYLERRRRGSAETFAALIRGERHDYPRREDGSHSAYAKRTSQAHAPDRFCLIVNNLQPPGLVAIS